MPFIILAVVIAVVAIVALGLSVRVIQQQQVGLVQRLGRHQVADLLDEVAIEGEQPGHQGGPIFARREQGWEQSGGGQ